MNDNVNSDGEHGEDDPDIERELRLLTSPPSCLTRRERRDALRLARRLGRVAADDERNERATLALFRSKWVASAKAAGLLVDPAYWRHDEAVLDARVEGFKRGFAESRGER